MNLNIDEVLRLLNRISRCLLEKLRHRRTIKNFLFVDSGASTNKKTFLLTPINKKERKLYTCVYIYKQLNSNIPCKSRFVFKNILFYI